MTADTTDQQSTVLTNRQGHPVHDNQNQRTVGAREPRRAEEPAEALVVERTGVDARDERRQTGVDGDGTGDAGGRHGIRQRLDQLRDRR